VKATQEQTEDLVRRVVEAVHPIRIILFGSAARGDVGLHSDIDVLVVMPQGTHRRRTAQTIYRHLLGFGLPVDVVVATTEDLDLYADSPGLVYKEALKEGTELYAA
jgi:uncharacterized protein